MKLFGYLKREELRRFLSHLYENEFSGSIKIEVSEDTHPHGHMISIECTNNMHKDLIANAFSPVGLLGGHGWHWDAGGAFVIMNA